MSNLLENPGFEGEWTRDTHVGVEFAEVFTPEGWVTWWSHEKNVPHDPENHVGYAKPETKIIPNEPPFTDPSRVRSGDKAFMLFTFWRIHDAGLYQQVTGITPGTQLKASAWGHAWSSEDDVAHTSINDDNISLQVGIDPTGGTDPFSDGIVWGKPRYIYDEFGQVSVKTVSAANTATVFLRSTALWPYKHCDVYWDDAQLTVISEGTGLDEFGIHLQITPTTPRVGETVSVSFTADSSLSDVRLSVTDPDGALTSVSPPNINALGDRQSWSYRFLPTKAGSYDVHFSDVDGTTTLARKVVVVAPEVTSEPHRGQPREQYTRVYILLPLGAGSEWIQAIVDSGRWEEKRWTIGASADDAGIGDLDQRFVIAVNPSSWPDDLEAFFGQHYPGVVYKPLPAASPQALRDLLEGIDI